MEQFIGFKCYVLKHHTQVIPGFKLQNYAMLRIFRENGRKLVLCNSFLYFVGATDSIINNWTCKRQKTYGFRPLHVIRLWSKLTIKILKLEVA
jgi:hypothetical protein